MMMKTVSGQNVWRHSYLRDDVMYDISNNDENEDDIRLLTLKQTEVNPYCSRTAI